MVWFRYCHTGHLALVAGEGAQVPFEFPQDTCERGACRTGIWRGALGARTWLIWCGLVGWWVRAWVPAFAGKTVLAV